MIKYILTFLAILSITTTTNAQGGVHRDLDPDKSIAAFWPQAASDTVRLAYDSSTSTPITLRVNIDTPGASITCLGADCELLDSTSSSMIAPIDSNTVISAGTPFGTWITPDAITGELLHDPNGSGHWQQLMNKYMGVRFKLNGNWTYGWIYMTVFYGFGSGMLTVVIQEYAYDTTGNDVTTGVIPTTSIRQLPQMQNVSATVHNNQVYIKGVNQPYSYKLIDVSGRVLQSSNKYNSNTIAVNAVPAGMYILQLNNKDGYYTTKLMIQ